jgi:hypothetical protein
MTILMTPQLKIKVALNFHHSSFLENIGWKQSYDKKNGENQMKKCVLRFLRNLKDYIEEVMFYNKVKINFVWEAWKNSSTEE